MPIEQDCAILKEYCQFIEIVEKIYNKRSPKRSFKKAIEYAMAQGILTDYLDRKSREVINMLCAKYDYKMDIAVKKEEAFQDGMQQKAIDSAINLLKMNILSPEQIAQANSLPLETVLKLQKEISQKA